MFSTRNASIRFLSRAAVVASATLFVIRGGCQRVQSNRPVALNDNPIVVDEAMQIRDWDGSTANYASGAVVAGAPRVTWEPKYDNRYNYAADPAIGVANIVTIPFTYIWTPWGQEVVHRGAITPPTHTAVPPVRVVE
jgi:hypothetical protein